MQGTVVKFGGSSVATTALISKVADGIIRRKAEAGHVVAVVSAMGKTTNNLIALSRELTDNPPKRETDMLLATGEQVSASLLCMALVAKGCPAISLTGWQAGILTEDSHTNSRIRSVDTERIVRALEDDLVVVVTGFQGVTMGGDITTLGRGGSDTTAVALAAVLNWPCEIYTDVEGIYTVDPRLHPAAGKIDAISYEETFELSCLGAKVIEPRSVEMAAKYGVDLRILLNTMDRPGTKITAGEAIMEENIINKVSVLDNVLLVTASGGGKSGLSGLFTKLADEKVNLDVISQSPSGGDVSFTASMDSEGDITRVLSGMGLEYNIKRDNCKVSIVGNAMRTHPGVAAAAFKAFSDNNLPFYQVSTSEISISFIVDADNKQQAVRALVQAFGL